MTPWRGGAPPPWRRNDRDEALRLLRWWTLGTLAAGVALLFLFEGVRAWPT